MHDVAKFLHFLLLGVVSLNSTNKFNRKTLLSFFLNTNKLQKVT